MAVRLVCRACGKRLKLPDGLTAKRSAKCPKCLAPVDLTPALEASAYVPTVAVPGKAPDPSATRKVPPLVGEVDARPVPSKLSAPPGPSANAVKSAPSPKSTLSPKPIDLPKPPSLLGEDDPLPYLPANEPEPPKSVPRPAPRSAGAATPLPDPARTAKFQGASTDQEILSLDDDPPGALPEEPVPFRVPVQVLADSLAAAVGPCIAVLLPHGLFLEHEPMKPFLYVPPNTRVDSPAAGELTVALPDGRSVTFRFQGRSARSLASDTHAFLAGERPVPVAADYQRTWWTLWAALLFALGPLVLSQAVDLGPKFATQVGAGLAFAGFLVNAAIVVFSRRSVPVQMIVMACGGVLVTGAFLFVATAYLAGRQEGVEQSKPDPPPAAPAPEPKPPDPLPERPPSHLDRAKRSGSSALEDGPADVTALALAPDGITLAIGYADGTVLMWKLDQPTFDPFLPGPKADGPVTRLQFDAKGRFVFAHTATGAVVAPRVAPPTAPAKLPGGPIAISSDLDAERVRFVTIRGNTVAYRLIASTFIQTPPKVEKGYALPGKGDEINPGAGKDPTKPRDPTFIAWPPGDRFFVGQSDGTIHIWSSARRADAPHRDHKAAVRAWAACIATGDFATGDDAGNVGIWSLTGDAPKVTSALATPVTGLSFSPSGARLAITDGTGWLVIWDPVAGKAIHRVKRPTAVKAMALGPGEDVIVLAAGRTVEVWWLPELVK